VRRTKENNDDAASSEARRELARLEKEKHKQRPGNDLLVVAEQDQQQKQHPIRHAAYADPWADSFGDDADDKYDGGNDLKVPSRHYHYRLDITCVAAEHRHKDETRAGCDSAQAARQAAAPTGANNDLAFAEDGAADEDDDDIFGDRPVSATPSAPAKPAHVDPLAELFDFGTGGDAEAEAKLQKEMMPSGTCRFSRDRIVKLVGKWKAPQLLQFLNSRDPVGSLCLRAFSFASDSLK
jgi:hypothetical protein